MQVFQIATGIGDLGGERLTRAPVLGPHVSTGDGRAITIVSDERFLLRRNGPFNITNTDVTLWTAPTWARCPPVVLLVRSYNTRIS